MNFLLQIIPQFWKWLTALPVKEQMKIALGIIVLGCVVYSFIKYLEHDTEVERIRGDVQIRLAELSTAKPDSTNTYKAERNPKRVKRIINKDTSGVAEIAFK